MDEDLNTTAIQAARGVTRRLEKFLEGQKNPKPICGETLLDSEIRCGLVKNHEGLHEAEQDILRRENALLLEVFGKKPPIKPNGEVELPWRDASAIKHDMKVLNLSGYAVCNGTVTEIEG
jgi:hypothetical protein